eukprot:42967-Eustigmatos_ZCMA.PRE.1
MKELAQDKAYDEVHKGKVMELFISAMDENPTASKFLQEAYDAQAFHAAIFHLKDAYQALQPIPIEKTVAVNEKSTPDVSDSPAVDIADMDVAETEEPSDVEKKKRVRSKQPEPASPVGYDPEVFDFPALEE